MKAIELFAGAGGLGMGVSKAGFTPELVVEWDKWCCDTVRENRSRKSSMVANWPIPHEGDVAKVDFRPFEDTIELVTGGPPCQPFSLGGKHRGSSDARDMWPQAVRAIREVRPKAFIFENVKGLARATFASYLAYIFHQLSHPEIVRKSGEKFGDHLARLERHHTSGSRSGLSYRVVYRVLNAADYGIPQRRERIVFVGFRDDLGIEWNFPKETHSFDVLAWEQCGSGAYWERHRVARKNRVISPRVAERAKVITGPYSTSAWRTTLGRDIRYTRSGISLGTRLEIQQSSLPSGRAFVSRTYWKSSRRTRENIEGWCPWRSRWGKYADASGRVGAIFYGKGKCAPSDLSR